MSLEHHLAGEGIYSLPEASKLTGISARDIRRWVFGYEYSTKKEKRYSLPLWSSQYASLGENDCIGFSDLLEIRFIRAFRSAGVPLQTIRMAVHKAREFFGHDYPLSSKNFRTDGRAIFARVLNEADEFEYLDLVKNQYAFRQVIEPSLYSSQIFERNIAKKWYPSFPNKQVIIDPEISFGKPILVRSCLRTSIVADAYIAEGTAEEVARHYEITTAEVRSAVEFENYLAA